MPNKIVIIGAGPGGYAAALRAARLGGEVTVLEREDVGGTCLNWGCIPSKILRTTAELLEKLHRASDFGLKIEGTFGIDLDRLMQRRQEIIGAQAREMLKLLKNNKVRYLQGQGLVQEGHLAKVELRDGRSIEVEWDRLILAVGSRPMGLPQCPFDGERVISSNEALNLSRIPGSILIIGGGVIGCEFAFIMNAFGSRVTVVEALPRVLPLPSVEEECSQTIGREMKKRKIRFLVGRNVSLVEEKDGKLQVTVEPSPSAEERKKKRPVPEKIEVDQILVCIGRRPNTEGLGLERLGVGVDERGWIKADERLETSVEDVYALGDVLGPSRVMLAHVASTEALVAAENAMGANRVMKYDAVPGAIFTLPEVANVGLTESQAREHIQHVKADSVLFRNMGKAQVIGETAGLAKIVSDAESGKVLGVHLVGPHATDLIAEGALSINAGVSIQTLAETIHAHPTLAEIMGEAALKVLHGH